MNTKPPPWIKDPNFHLVSHMLDRLDVWKDSCHVDSFCLEFSRFEFWFPPIKSRKGFDAVELTGGKSLAVSKEVLNPSKQLRKLTTVN